MTVNFAAKTVTVLAVLLAGLSASGCYYMQAARGQLEVMRRSEPIETVVAEPGTPGSLSRRLRLVQEARAFSIAELGLPDNESYRSYAALDRDFVVWNVFAAPEFSTRPREWCFPVAGCVGYRGYFAEAAARRKADRLRADGFDVAVGGVPAYSTLGRLDDPVLSTMLRWDDVDLVAMLFHELAHQLLYVKGDTAFNESFATVVEETGIERWLEARGQDADYETFRHRQELQGRVIGLVETARGELDAFCRKLPHGAMIFRFPCKQISENPEGTDFIKIMILRSHPEYRHKIACRMQSFQISGQLDCSGNLVDKIQGSCENIQLMSGGNSEGVRPFQQINIPCNLTVRLLKAFILFYQSSVK